MSWALISFGMNHGRLNWWQQKSSDRRNSSVISLMFCFNRVNHMLLDIFTANILHRPTVDINEEPQSISTGKAVDTLALAGEFSSTATSSRDLPFSSCPLLSVR